MFVKRLALIALVSLTAACAAGVTVKTDSKAGHFGAGLHAGRVAGR